MLACIIVIQCNKQFNQTLHQKSLKNIMKNTSKTSKHCPSAIDLEYLFLEEGLNEESRKRIQLHLQQCSSCRETLEKIESYYKLLIHELSRPVSNKVIDFSKKLSNHPEIRYGLIICEPADLNKSEPGTYKTKVLFQANGVPGKTSLKDFDLLSLPKDQIAIRIMTILEKIHVLFFFGTIK